jgi:hypothetical protein
MRYHTTAVALAAASLPALLYAPPEARAQSIIASSGFNDQAGLHSNNISNSPFQLGETVNGFGAGEPGWAGPWAVSAGGAQGGFHLGKAERFAAKEGDGGLSIVPHPEGSWVLRQLATLQTRQFVIEQDVNFVAAGSLNSRPFHSRTTQPGSFGPVWRIFGPRTNRRFQVMDGDGAGSGTFEETGIAQKPGQWQHVVVEVDVATQTWGFKVDNKTYVPPDPLNFRGSPAGIDVIEYLTDSSGYVDSVIVREPGPVVPWHVADLNGDGRVDVADLGILSTNFNNLPNPGGRAGGDINGDGVVNVADLGILSSFYGEPRPAGAEALSFQQDLAAYADLRAVVPEPSAMALMVLAWPGLLVRERRRQRGRGRSC